jgi:hypothetical protein
LRGGGGKAGVRMRALRPQSGVHSCPANPNHAPEPAPPWFFPTHVAVGREQDVGKSYSGMPRQGVGIEYWTCPARRQKSGYGFHGVEPPSLPVGSTLNRPRDIAPAEPATRKQHARFGLPHGLGNAAAT